MAVPRAMTAAVIGLPTKESEGGSFLAASGLLRRDWTSWKGGGRHHVAPHTGTTSRSASDLRAAECAERAIVVRQQSAFDEAPARNRTSWARRRAAEQRGRNGYVGRDRVRRYCGGS
jgi:hypothetical protein